MSYSTLSISCGIAGLKLRKKVTNLLNEVEVPKVPNRPLQSTIKLIKPLKPIKSADSFF